MAVLRFVSWDLTKIHICNSSQVFGEIPFTPFTSFTHTSHPSHPQPSSPLSVKIPDWHRCDFWNNSDLLFNKQKKMLALYKICYICMFHKYRLQTITFIATKSGYFLARRDQNCMFFGETTAAFPAVTFPPKEVIFKKRHMQHFQLVMYSCMLWWKLRNRVKHYTDLSVQNQLWFAT